MTTSELTQAIERALKNTPKGATISRIQLFGSRLDGYQRPDSDYDFLFEYSGNLTMFSLYNLKMSLEEELSAKVDLIPRDSIHPVIKKDVYASAQTVYEK